MVFQKYKYNEDKMFNKKIKEKVDADADYHICEDIRRYCEEMKTENGSLLLDREPPLKGHIKETLENFVNDKKFSAITMTYNNTMRMNMNELELKIALKNTISTICFNHLIPIEILLLPDCDEAGNFHYHGVVNLPNKYRPTFKRLITKHIGFMKFDYIREPTGWYDYVIKKDKDIYSDDDIKYYSIHIRRI